jgi:hypothetical protein
MSFPHDPPDSAKAREKQNPLDSFAAESTSPSSVAPSSAGPSAIDEVIQKVRSRAAGDASTAAHQMPRFRERLDSLARYLRAHTMHLAWAAVAAVIVAVGIRAWPTIGETATTLGERLLTTVITPGTPAAPEEAASAAAGSKPVRPPRAARPAPGANVPRVPERSPSAPPEQEAIPAKPAADLTRRTDAPSAAPLAEERAGTAEIVYSSADVDVQPPKIRSVEPGQPTNVMSERTRLIEVLVKADGTVEQVLLRSPEGRLPDAMLLSRAKMWQFEPAQRAGRPVWYRLRLMWESPP